MNTRHMFAAWGVLLLPWAAVPAPFGRDVISHEVRVAAPIAKAFESAWLRSLEAVRSEGRFARAAAQREVASSFLAAPPEIELGHRRASASGSSTERESEAVLVLPLWLPGQQRARGAAASAQSDLARASLEEARLRVAGEVREAAWQLVAAQQEEAAARVHAEALQDLAADVDRRVEAGELAPADALAATAELLAARSALTQAASRIDTARGRWELLTGLPAIAHASEADPPAGIAEHPAVALARSAAESAQREVEYVRVARRDPIEVSVQVRRETADANLPAQNGVGVGLRIPFGTAVRNAPRDAEVHADLAEARAEQERVARRLDSEARIARAAVESAQRRLEAERSRSALLRERLQLIDKSFRAGESPLPELLRARSAAAEAEAALLRQQAELGLARAMLLQALGVLP